MTVLSAQSIRRRGLVYPCHERQEIEGMTYGLSPAGYDVRVEFDPDGTISGIHIPPKGFVLASTMEYLRLPSDVQAIVHDKSSWARRGLTVQNTVGEPGWEGYLTLELTNHSDVELSIRRGAPIAQVVFHLLDEPSQIPYCGKYNLQERGPQRAR